MCFSCNLTSSSEFGRGGFGPIVGFLSSKALLTEGPTIPLDLAHTFLNTERKKITAAFCAGEPKQRSHWYAYAYISW